MNRNWKQIWIRFAMVLMLAVAIPFQSFAGNARIAFSDPTEHLRLFNILNLLSDFFDLSL